jgi:membrane protein
LIGATGVFAEIQDSINSIWGLKATPKAGIMKLIKTRLLSFGMIGSIGFLLLVSLGASAVIEGLSDRLQQLVPSVTIVIFYVINFALTLGITTLLFALVFKVLPDAKIKWKDIMPGAITTSVLFLIGKFLISLYISKSDVGSTYGAAGSLVILLLWVYYSAIILYFGAEFTKFYAFDKGARIEPNEYAEWVQQPPVAGARQTPASQPARKPERSQLPKRPQLATASQERTRRRGEAKSSPGMGTALLGFVLYYFNRNRKP